MKVIGRCIVYSGFSLEIATIYLVRLPSALFYLQAINRQDRISSKPKSYLRRKAHG